MTQLSAITAPRIFDGYGWHAERAVVIEDGRVTDIAPAAALPNAVQLTELQKGCLVPGFVDLQVNGGGGVLLNDDPSLQTIERICRAHAAFGTTALLPTLITDTPETTQRAITAAAAAMDAGVPGYAGLHLEGPHLSTAKRGAHDAALVRTASDEDIAILIEALASVRHLLVTMAPEAVTSEQVKRLAAAGVRVSLGHSDAGIAEASAMLDAGARMVTHLFNAMSPLTHREPGVVGAALHNPTVYVGLIADGFHVHPAAMGIALRAKQGPGRLFLVTDAMSTVGSDIEAFKLNDRLIRRAAGRLTLEDGTLAGADIDMMSSIRVLLDAVGLPLDEALRMASLYPSEAMGMVGDRGCLQSGSRADMVHLSEELEVRQVWIGGKNVHRTDKATRSQAPSP